MSNKSILVGYIPPALKLYVFQLQPLDVTGGGGRGQGRFCNEQVWTGHQMSLAGVAFVYSGEGVGFMFMWPIPWCMWCTYTPSTPVRMVGRHLWKHYLPATSLAGSNNIMALRIKLPADN